MIPGANAPSSVGDLRPLLILVCLLEVMVPLTTALLIVVNCEKDLTSGNLVAVTGWAMRPEALCAAYPADAARVHLRALELLTKHRAEY